jgi:hypothetical protein
LEADPTDVKKLTIVFSLALVLAILGACQDFFDPPPPAERPDPPSGVSVQAGDGEIRLSWQGSNGANGYNVYRSESEPVETSVANRRNATLIQTTEFVDRVDNNVTYYYVVTAVGPGGVSQPSSPIEARPSDDIPAAPSELVATPGDGQVSLSWQASPAAARYHVYRGESEDVTPVAENRVGTPQTPSFIDREVVNGVTYYYLVTAVSSSDVESAGSNVASARPEAGIALRPQVIGVIPPDGATNVALGEFVTTELYLPNGGFNEATLTDATVRLIREDGQQVPANLNYSGGRDTFTLQPDNPLDPNTTYRFEVSDGLKDDAEVPFLPFVSTFTTGSDDDGGNGEIVFEKVVQAASEGEHYTSLVIGPDGKLYATTVFGQIKRFDILEDGTLAQAETLSSLVDAEGEPRLLIGLIFDPAATAANLVAWATHTVLHDPRSAIKPDDWTGKVTRLSGPGLETVEDYVVGLPRSTIDHATNIPAFGPDGALYVPQGSNTAMGAPDSTWGNRPERLLAGAILRVDLTAIDHEMRPLDVKTDEGGAYDPFAADAPVTIYATGIRNAYHLLWHSNGQLYVPTNGSAAGGNTPATPSPLPEACERRIDAAIHGPYTGPQVPGLTRVSEAMPDFLFRVEEGGYYGHPNPERCEWVMNGGNPSAGNDPAQVNDYPVGVHPDRNWRGFASEFNLHASSNGIIEYKSDVFGGQLQGKMMVVRFNRYNDIIVLTPGGADEDYRIVAEENFGSLSGFLTPLALVENTANGHIYVAEFNRSVSGFSLDELVTVGLEPTQAGSQPRITLLRPTP